MRFFFLEDLKIQKKKYNSEVATNNKITGNNTGRGRGLNQGIITKNNIKQNKNDNNKGNNR